MSINSIKRSKQLSSLLQYDNKNQTDAERRTLVMNKLDHLSGKNCFLSTGPRPKLRTCQCSNLLHGDNDNKRGVADYILFFAKLDKGRRLMFIIETLKVVLDVQNRNNPQLCILPFVASEDKWIKEFLKNVFICEEVLGMLFGSDGKGLTALADHAIHHTLPLHGLTGRVPKFNTKFKENVVPSLAYFFKNYIVPMTGARPTQCTRCVQCQEL